MFDISMTEWAGYLASIVVLISFLMKDFIKLRIVNSVGCALFVAYGFLLNMSFPIIITNSVIIGINVFFLLKHFRNK